MFSKESVKIIRDDLIQVIENPNGTGHSAKTEGVTIAGKTGTAEIKASKMILLEQSLDGLMLLQLMKIVTNSI